MQNSKIVTDFSRLSDARLETKAQAILTAMTGNTNFPTPAPTLPEVTTATNNYIAALATAQSGDKTAIATKNLVKEALIAVLKSLGSYVTYTAEGSREKLVSSGFTLAKDDEPAELVKPQNLKIKSGINGGEVNVSVTSVAGARSYVHQYSTEPLTESSWTSTPSTRCRHTYENLQQGQKLWFRVAAIGARGQLAYSDAIAKIIQ